jgi:hypothetical protein
VLSRTGELRLQQVLFQVFKTWQVRAALIRFFGSVAGSSTDRQQCLLANQQRRSAWPVWVNGASISAGNLKKPEYQLITLSHRDVPFGK